MEGKNTYIDSQVANLFNPEKTDVTVEKYSWVPISTHGAIDKNTEVFEFTAARNKAVFWSLKKSFLTIKGKVVKGNGDKLQIADHICVINALGNLTLQQTCNIITKTC